MSEATKELIQMALDQDYNNANKTFGEIMTIKMNDLLDQEKIRLSDQIYNGIEQEDDISDDEVEAMLDTDEDEDAVEEEELQEPDTDDEVGMDDEDDADEDEGLEREDDNEGDEGSDES